MPTNWFVSGGSHDPYTKREQSTGTCRMSVAKSWISRVKSWGKRHIPLVVAALTILSGSVAYALVGGNLTAENGDTFRTALAIVSTLAAVLAFLVRYIRNEVRTEVRTAIDELRRDIFARLDK